jgi:hypothetical protein
MVMVMAIAMATATAKVTAMVMATVTGMLTGTLFVTTLVRLLVLPRSIILCCQKSTTPTSTLRQTMHPKQTKPPAATAVPLTVVVIEDDKDKQGASPPLSPTCLTNVVKDIMGQPLAQKKSTISN